MIMKNIILFDTESLHLELLPLTFTRPISDIRFGIFTIREKWEQMYPGNYSYKTNDYLAKKYPLQTDDNNYFIAGNVCPDKELIQELDKLSEQESLFYNDELIAFYGTLDAFQENDFGVVHPLKNEPLSLRKLYDIFINNNIALERDYKIITSKKQSAPLPASNRVIGNPNFEDGTPKIFIEPGASIECVTLNVTQGPIYIGKDAEIMENSSIRAPFAACEHVVVNMGTKIYGATTLGPYCKVGGELNNVIMQAYSNKGHDGFLGNAVIGEWCNLGAGTNASNLKNDYSEIKLWNYPSRRFLRTGLQFCGLIMGDHSKAGINCMFNTATVLGVGVNVHGSGFPRNFVASFSEGGTAGFSDVPLSRFFSSAERMMARRGKVLTEVDRAIFEAIHDETENLK